MSPSQPTQNAATSETLAQALGKIASGVTVLTLMENGVPHGMLASWVMQAGFAPPMLTVAVNKEREMLKHLNAGQGFALNILPEGEFDLMKRFSRHQPEAFERLATQTTESGVLLTATIAALECRVESVIDTTGDHVLVLATVTEGHVFHPDVTPWCHTRKTGMSY